MISFLKIQAPPTRAKSPKLGRRKSFSDSKDPDRGADETRHSFHIFRDTPSMPSTNRKIKSNKQNQGGEMDEPYTSNLMGERHMDISVHS